MRREQESQTDEDGAIMTDLKPTPTLPLKAKRERSPAFPFIPLKTAVERLASFDEYSKRHPVPAKHVGPAWGFKGFTSQAQQTLAALKYFGFIEYQGSGESLGAVLSDEGRLYLRSQQESIKQEILKRAALKPKAIAKYFAKWGAARPNDAICLDDLVIRGGFNGAGAKIFLAVYDETISYAKLSESDKGGLPELKREEDDLEEDDGANKPPPLSEPPLPAIKVGDFVQWNSNGVDQFNPPRKVIEIFPDGRHVIVFGSSTGIPMAELTVVDPPAPPPVGGVARPTIERGSAWGAGDNQLNVLQSGGRLQITADVDLEGLQELKAMLDDYESILTRLSKRHQRS